MKKITGDLTAGRARIAIVSSRFNQPIVSQLVQGAEQALLEQGVAEENLVHVEVPGAFEIPLAIQQLAESHKYDGIVALGCLIRGETGHYDHVANECVRGIAELSIEHGLPVSFGVLAADNGEDAKVRADVNGKNKGAEWALAALEMINLIRQIHE